MGLNRQRVPSHVVLQSVDLGLDRIRIPIFEREGEQTGKTLCIAAGIDGDEYAGIDAAWKLIERFEHTPFAGKLVILPVVNLPGFMAEMSKNPLDDQYPKFVFPGNNQGTPSERLMFFLYSRYLNFADFWLDFHGGSLVEQVRPHVWTAETKNREVNEFVLGLTRHLLFDTVIYQKRGVSKKSEMLAANGCGYLMTESGQLGERYETSIERHVQAAHIVMDALDMIETDVPRARTPERHRQVVYHNASTAGFWHPAYFADAMRKDTLIGEIRDLSGVVKEQIYAKVAGTFLWGKRGMRCQPGDELCVIASR